MDVYLQSTGVVVDEETYLTKLNRWYQDAKIKGQVVDIKLDLDEYVTNVINGKSLEETLEVSAKAIYETLTGKREVQKLSTKDL